MLKAIVVDRDYGSVSPQELNQVGEAYARAGIQADLAAAMILGLIRNTVYYDREIRRGRWPKCQYLLPGNVREMTLGLFGFGQAGRLLHDIFHNGFGTRVIACDPYISREMKAA